MIKATTSHEAYLDLISWMHNNKSGQVEIYIDNDDHRKNFKKMLDDKKGIAYNAYGNPVVISVMEIPQIPQ